MQVQGDLSSAHACNQGRSASGCTSSRSSADDAALPLSGARVRAAVRQGRRMAAPNSALPKISPLAGKPARAVDARQRPAAGHGLLRPSSPIRPCRRSASPSAPRATAARRSSGASTRRTSSRSRRRSASTARQQGIDGPLFLGMDTHALSEPAFATRARGARRQRRRGDDRRERRLHADAGHLARDPRRYNRGRTTGSPTASSSRRRTIRRRTAASSTTRRNGGPADTDVTGWIEDARQRAARRRAARRAAHAATRRRCAAATTHRTTTSTPTSTTSATCSTSTRSAAPGSRIGVDPLGGAGVALLGRASPSATASTSTVVNDDGRSDLPLHDASTGTARSAWTARRRTRWQRLIALKDRFDVAFASDTDHDRHGIVTPQRRAAEPEPLPRRSRSTTCSAPAAAGAPTPASARRWSAAA